MGTERVRERLGWAVEAGVGFEAVTQREAGCGPTRGWYLRGPEGRVLHLTERFHFGAHWEWWEAE
jgi:hypothetical protein